MKKYFVIESDVSEAVERLSTLAYNKAEEVGLPYSRGYAQGVADVLEFALRRGEVAEIEKALRYIIIGNVEA